MQSFCFIVRQHKNAEKTSWNKWKIELITLFLERVKVVVYVIFIIVFFLVGFIGKQIELEKYSWL